MSLVKKQARDQAIQCNGQILTRRMDSTMYCHQSVNHSWFS